MASLACPHHASPLQYLGDLGCEYVVYKNDEKSVEEIRAMNPRGILVSPGPGACTCRAARRTALCAQRHAPWAAACHASCMGGHRGRGNALALLAAPEAVCSGGVEAY